MLFKLKTYFLDPKSTFFDFNVPINYQLNEKEEMAVNDLNAANIENLSNILNNNLQYTESVYKLRNYYENLTENFGTNVVGSCGYVAITSILTYFDTYWDDNIIPEQYDVDVNSTSITNVLNETSPGCIYDNTLLHTSESVYRAECLRTSDYNLHSLLISQNSSLSVSVLGTEAVLKKFFPSSYDNAFIYLPYQFDNNMTTEQKNFLAYTYVSSAIDRGLPVILNIQDATHSKRHAVVAYSYNASNIICHFGWKGSPTDLGFDYGDYVEIYALMILVPRMLHYHSNNYVIEHEDGFKYFYCPCPETLGHTHDFSTYEEIDESGHLAICSTCNEENIEPHMLTGETYKTCVKCGWTNYFDDFIPIM